MEKQRISLLQIQTAEKFIPYLLKDYESQKVALLMITSLGNKELAARFTDLYKTEGTKEAGDIIMASTASVDQTELPKKIFTSPPPISQKEGLKEEWAYLGDYSITDGKWNTRYFEFSSADRPEIFIGKILKVREETGSLNVRKGMPTQMGAFPKVIDILDGQDIYGPGFLIMLKNKNMTYLICGNPYLHLL